jgi:hypothetical protein
VSCDTHVHTLTHSGHGDATVEERMLTFAGEGIELPIATEHNLHADYSEAARRMGVAAFIHAGDRQRSHHADGAFQHLPDCARRRGARRKITLWPPLMRALRDTPGVRVVVLNHPRSIHSKFRPFGPENFDAATGENKRGGEFSFDAIEVLNSGAQQTDYMLVFRDWFALLNRGHRFTAVGASDSHDVSRFIVGQARTYIAAQDDESGPDRCGCRVSKACSPAVHW